MWLQSPPTSSRLNSDKSLFTRRAPQHSNISNLIMPPERTALGSISGNSHCRPDLSPFQRGQISGMKTNGATPTQISKRLKFPISTVRSTIGLEHL